MKKIWLFIALGIYSHMSTVLSLEVCPPSTFLHVEESLQEQIAQIEDENVRKLFEYALAPDKRAFNNLLLTHPWGNKINTTIKRGSLLHVLVQQLGEQAREVTRLQKQKKLSKKEQQDLAAYKKRAKKYKSMLRQLVMQAPRLKLDFTLKDVEEFLPSGIAFRFTQDVASMRPIYNALAELEETPQKDLYTKVTSPDILDKFKKNNNR